MSSYVIQFASYLIRNFIPMNPFHVNFLVETKEFTNFEVSSSITPFYFFSAFFTIFVCKPILHFLGLTYSSIVFTGLQILNTVIFLNLMKRSFNGARIVYLISGFIFTFEAVYRFYLSERATSESSTDTKYALLQLWKAVVSSISSVVGEEIVRKTRFYEINIHISIMMQFLSLCVSIYSAVVKEKDPPLKDANMIDSLLDMDTAAFCALCSGVLCGCLSLFLKLFSNSIFRDKRSMTKVVEEQADDDRKEQRDANTPINTIHIVASTNSIPDDTTAANKVSENISQSNQCSTASTSNEDSLSISKSLQNIIAIPIRMIADLLIYLVRLVFPVYETVGNARKTYLNGYLDAILNIMCYAAPMLITKYVPESYKERLSVLFLFTSSWLIIITVKQDNRMILYILYVIVGVSTRSCSALTKKLLKTGRADNNLIIVSYLIESVLHIGINYISRVFKANAVMKATVYGCIGQILIAVIILLR